MAMPLEFPYRRGTQGFEVSLPCANCGDEVAMSWPPSAGNSRPARLVARCRTCQEVAYTVVRGDDGICRVHPCGPGPYASWPSDAWRAPPQPGSRGPIYSTPAKNGYSSNSRDRSFSPAGYLGPAAPVPRRQVRPASAPRARGPANIGVGARRRGVSADRVRFQDEGEGRYDVEDDVYYEDRVPNDGYWHGVYDRAPPAKRGQAAPLLRTFAAAVFARFPDEASAFYAFDLNGNGIITLSEFQAVADSLRFQGDAASVFWELDTSRRGTLGRREFAMLRRWAPQAAALRPTPLPSEAPRMRPQKAQVFDRWMPPAGQYVEPIGYETGQRQPSIDRGGIADRRKQRHQKGQGVAAALDSWGEWRNWQDGDIRRSFAGSNEPPPYRHYRQNAWDVLPEQQFAYEGDPYDIPYDDGRLRRRM